MLANVDSSITQLKLEHDLRIEGLDEATGFDLIRDLEGLPSFSLSSTLTHFPRINFSEKKMYVVVADIQADKILRPEVVKFDNEVLMGYLDSSLRLARLFKQGNICIPASYYYFSDISQASASMIRSTAAHVARELFSLSDDIEALQRFITETKLPFTESYLRLAFQNFESSYGQHGTQLPFLLCMMARSNVQPRRYGIVI